MITKFSKWVPPEIKIPKAVLVLTPPSQLDGREEVNNLDWQTFAKANGLALVGCFFQDDVPTGIERYCDMNNEAGAKLLMYLMSEFKPLPTIFLWGFSAGGQFNYEFTCSYPFHVGGFVVNKGGIYYTALANSAARSVPGLFIIGEKDAAWRKDIVKGIVSVNGACGARWVLVSEADQSHAVGKSRELGKEFFTKLLKGHK